MTKPSRLSSAEPQRASSFKIGRTASAAISQIEGLSMSRDMQSTFAQFDREGLSHEERRAALLKKYGGKKG